MRTGGGAKAGNRQKGQSALLAVASKSRCRSLYPVALLALNTGMRADEIRGQSAIDFAPGVAQNWAQFLVSEKSDEAVIENKW